MRISHCGCGPRAVDCRQEGHGRDAVQRLCDVRIQPNRQQPRQDSLALGSKGRRRRAHAHRRRGRRRAVPQPEHRGLVLPRAGPEDRLPLHPWRRQGLVGDGHRRPQPRAVFRAQIPLPQLDRPCA